MGMKKLARKRLFDVEKKGIDVDVGVSDAMKPALVSATQLPQLLNQNRWPQQIQSGQPEQMFLICVG